MIPEVPTFADAPGLLDRILSPEQKLAVLIYDDQCGHRDAGAFLALGEIGIYPDSLNNMINIELTNRDITGPGLYLMRWKNQTGLVRIVGQPKTGYTIIQPEKGAEHLFQGLPPGGQVPMDALLSEPLSVTKV